MMIKNYDESVEVNKNSNWLYILDDPYRMLIIGSSGSSKTNMLLNLMKHERSCYNLQLTLSKIHLNQNIHFFINGRKK